MGKPSHEPDGLEFRARAVELVCSSALSRAQGARDLGRRDGLTTDEKAELARLRREVAVLKEEREILKKAAAFFARESTTR